MQMVQPRMWTLDELHGLPDDGNRYELVRGELFVTPAPGTGHESLLLCLQRIIEPYVVANGLGSVFGPRSVIRARGSEVEPDLMVRPFGLPLPDRWEELVWHPASASESLIIDVRAFFRAALG